jgi:phage baseplate assembly protein W
MSDQAPFGFAFPFRFDSGSGVVATSDDDEHIRESLAFLLQTELDERVMRREHGAGLLGLLHAPMNTAFLQLVRHQVGRAVLQHEPRVLLVDLRVSPGEEGVLEIDLVYAVRRTQRTQRMTVSLPTRI